MGHRKSLQEARARVRRSGGGETTSQIDGSWVSEPAEKDDYKYYESINIEQRGGAISGYLEYVQQFNDSSRPKVKRFSLEGHYRDRTLALLYQPEDRSYTSLGCLVAFMKADHEFEGHCVYYDGDAGQVESDQYLLKSIKYKAV